MYNIYLFEFIACMNGQYGTCTGLGNEMGKKKGEVGLTVVEWGGGELACPLL
jgi:hypothetical protein